MSAQGREVARVVLEYDPQRVPLRFDDGDGTRVEPDVPEVRIVQPFKGAEDYLEDDAVCHYAYHVVPMTPGERFESSTEKGRIAARAQAWRTLYNALTLCQFQNPGAAQIARALHATTGWDMTVDDLMIIGKRIVTLKRLLNLRRGLTRADERLPDLLLRPLDGGTEGNVPDVEALLAGAYAEFGWDMETGAPLAELRLGG